MTVLEHAIIPFLHHPNIRDVLVVTNAAHMPLYAQATANLALPSPVIGGQTRQDSVLNGLQALAALPEPPDYVLIHDAARPGVCNRVIGSVICALCDGDTAVTPTLPIADTLRHIDYDILGKVADRDHLRAVQTPQGFAFAPLLDAFAKRKGKTSNTDESLLMSAAGHYVRSVEGSPRNMKLTYPEDTAMLNALLSRPVTISASGTDIHPLAHNSESFAKPMVLGGVVIPGDYHLVGHSDADVILHALCDAIYGALGDGDIGVHFPPSDMQWKDADSKRFLAHAMQKIQDAHGKLIHVDITLLAEKPRLSAHRDAIIQSVAQLCDLPEKRVGLKATTTEKLGFIGREEGVLAQVTITLELPDA